jgi:hypothetical protein
MAPAAVIIHVCDLVRAHSDALAYLRSGGTSATLNCSDRRDFSVLDVTETVRRVSGVDFKVEVADRRRRYDSHRRDRGGGRCSNGSRISTICKPSSATRWERKLGMRAS